MNRAFIIQKLKIKKPGTRHFDFWIYVYFLYEF